MTPPATAAAPCTAAKTPYAVARLGAGTRSATSAFTVESSTPPSGSQRGQRLSTHRCRIDQRNSCHRYNMILGEVVGDDGKGDQPCARRRGGTGEEPENTGQLAMHP
jgi:hypothetical protein